ncbi:unnamed protein product [Mytilus coruscus]|uniref:MAM domain-containing protein n=1 Tax=Mytilus coruscus TaxID=42192 RepID=A0A6J8EGD4_MYTCO|nr:unnamed protein product [Mytilus coruscus]
MVQANRSNKAVLKHRFKDNGGDRCLTFSYKFFNNISLKLSVVDFKNISFQHELWELSYTSGDWMEAAIAITSQVTEIHVIASQVFSHLDGGVAIDDIEVLKRTCKDTNVFNCHFNNGDTCGYTNSKTDIGYWEMHQSITLSKTEWCLRFNGDNFPPGTKARLTSSILQSTGPRCFRFVYKLCHQNANYLSVLVGYVFNGLKFYGSSLWTRSVGNMDCSIWSKGHVDIPSIALDHFIAIQVERGHQSDSVYIDDILLQSGNCFK